MEVSLGGVVAGGGNGDAVVGGDETGGSRRIEAQRGASGDGRERTFRFLQTSQALQTLARTTLLGL